VERETTAVREAAARANRREVTALAIRLAATAFRVVERETTAAWEAAEWVRRAPAFRLATAALRSAGMGPATPRATELHRA